MSQTTSTMTAPQTRQSASLLFRASVLLLCAWVLVPIYLVLINTLSSPDAVNGFPKSILPEFDFGSLIFFAKFYGMVDALKTKHADKFEVSIREAGKHKDELKSHGIKSHGVVVLDGAGETLWMHGDHQITQAEIDEGAKTVLGKLK